MKFTSHLLTLRPGTASSVVWRGLAAVLLVLSISTAGMQAAIPDRPEKLKFEPLEYQPPQPQDYRVPLKSGPVAYLVPNLELPLVNLVVYVRAGGYSEAKGQEGLADLTGYLLARGGTEKMTAEELEEKLDYLAAQLNSNVSETHGMVSLNLLSKDLDQGLSLLRDVLATPRFQQDKLSLRKQQTLQQLKQRNDDSADIEFRERRVLVYGEDFWINRLPTAKSIEAVKQEDLRAFHQKWFVPSNFVVAVSGHFERDKMVTKLETLFGRWPYKGQVSPPIPTNTVFATPGTYLIDKDVNQGRVSILLPGIHRESPDYYAVTLMNDILGGGGFTSRIMNRVRSDEGLAYSAASAFAGGAYFPGPFVASFQSKSRSVAYASSLVLEELKRIAAEPVTAEELNTAKNGLIQSFPSTFTTKAQTAALFAQDELTGRFARDPHYWKNFRTKMEAVNASAIREAARKYLTPDKLVLLVVGQKGDILKGDPTHSVSLPSLLGKPIVDLPLRDPLTLEPIRTINR